MIKLLDILLENDGGEYPLDILHSRRNKKEREKNYNIVIQKQLQHYIANGSKGDLFLNKMPIKYLPDNLKTVGGNLDLRGSKIVKLPDNLTVNGDLDLKFSEITELPENLTVNGFLSISLTNIQRIPESLVIKSHLLAKTLLLESFPNNLKVGGVIMLDDTHFKNGLPDNLTVNTDFDLISTNLTKLPENLTVNGVLNIENTGVSEIPDSLVVTDSLSVENTPVAKKLREIYRKTRNWTIFKTLYPKIRLITGI
jgi:hypothetical protein